ncbi:hypothetical protein BAU15_08375 [Enterococcus sp. JM4C]|nr:hypothetical protein BAU15_08375 [Enterococcus sp. JM4C]
MWDVFFKITEASSRMLLWISAIFLIFALLTLASIFTTPSTTYELIIQIIYFIFFFGMSLLDFYLHFKIRKLDKKKAEEKKAEEKDSSTK